MARMSPRLPGATLLVRALLPGALLVLSSPAVAATVTGEVVDARTGEPVAGARASVRGGDTALSVAEPGEIAATGKAGAFRLQDAPDTPFILVVSRDGYEPWVGRVTPGEPVTCRLEPLRYPEEEMVVAASRYGGGVQLSQTDLTAETLERRHTVQDPPALLEDTPGVYVASDSGLPFGYTYLDIRGFDQRRVGVMVNGIPWNDPEDHQVYWVDLPDLVASVEDAQVQRGVAGSPGSTGALAGTVNLVTDPHGADPEARMALYGGSYATSRQMASYSSGLVGGRLSTVMRVSHLSSEGFRDRAGVEQTGWFFSGRLLGPRATTTLNVYGGHEISGQAFEGIPADLLDEDPTYNPETYAGAVDDFRQPHVELHHDWDLSEAWTLEQSLYYIAGHGHYENWKDDRTAEDFGLDRALGLEPDDEVDLVRRKYVDKHHVGWVPRLTWAHGRGRLVLGGDAYAFRSHHYGEVTEVEGYAPSDLGSGLEYYAYDGEKLAASVYADERLELFEGLTVLATVQQQFKTYDFAQQEVGGFEGEDRHAYTVDYAFFSPKGGLHWRTPLEGLALFAFAGRAYREPADSELFDTWDGPDDLGVEPLFASSEPVMRDGEVQYLRWSDPLVEPERVLDLETGASWRRPGLQVSVNGYWMDLENEIVSYGAIDDDGAAVRGNADHTVHRGVEAMVKARLLDAHQLHVAASRSWDRFVDHVVYEDEWDPDTWEHLGATAVDLSGNPIAGFPEWLVSAHLASEVGPVTAMLGWRGAGRQYLDNTGDPDRSIDPYHVVDLGLLWDLGGVRWLEGFTLDARLENVLDARYATGGYYDAWGEGNTVFPAAGRHGFVGVRYGF